MNDNQTERPTATPPPSELGRDVNLGRASRDRPKPTTCSAKPSEGDRFLQTAKPRGPAGQEVSVAARKGVFIESDPINKVDVGYRH